MKKIMAVLLAAFLFVGMTAVGVSAEETTAAVTETTTAVAETTTIVEETTTTAEETTTTTEVTTTTTEATTTVAPQRVAVTLTASFNADGTLTVKAVDATGAPARGYEVSLVLQGMPEIGYTSDQGTYTSNFDVDEGKAASFEGVETQVASLIYEACAKQTLEREVTATTTDVSEMTTVEGETTTTVTEETTTAVEETTTTVTETTTTEQQTTTTVGTTASTTATIKANSTTAAKDDMIAMNAVTDTALLEMFGLTRQEFLSKARLLVSEEDYQKLVGRTGNTPMLSVRTSVAAITPSMVQAALSNVSEFSGYSEDQRQMLTFDLSLLMLSRTGKEVPVTALPEDVIYTIQLPIPTAMKNASAFAITVMDGDKLMAPQKLEVKNGLFELKINSLEAYTLIAFGEEDEGSAGGISWRLTVLLVAGILLVVGAGILLYFFVFRKPDETTEEEQTESREDSDTDIYSGRTDNTWDPEDN